MITAGREGRSDSLPGEPALRQLEEARASSRAVRAYLLFPPPFCAGNPRPGWKQMTHFTVLTSICPGAPAQLATAAHLIAPMLPALRDLALSASSTDGSI